MHLIGGCDFLSYGAGRLQLEFKIVALKCPDDAASYDIFEGNMCWCMPDGRLHIWQVLANLTDDTSLAFNT